MVWVINIIIALEDLLLLKFVPYFTDQVICLDIVVHLRSYDYNFDQAL